MTYIGLYLAAIVAANLSVAHFGVGMTYVNAFLFIGLDLVAKDRLQDAWQGRYLIPKMGALIASGSILSYALNRNAGTIALASFLAFAAAAVADGLVYQRLRDHPWMVRANGSNLLGAAVDSLVFPTVAFGGLNWVITAGQFAAKIAGGFVWSFVLLPRRRCAWCGERGDAEMGPVVGQLHAGCGDGP